MGRNWKKYRLLENGAKKATPCPPFVKASKNPCEAVATDRYSDTANGDDGAAR